MEEEAMEELSINEMLANCMESNFSLANPQQSFPGSIELLKLPDIWIGYMEATNCTTFKKEGGKNVKESFISTHGIMGDVVEPDKEMDIEFDHYDKYDGNIQQKGLTFSAESYMKDCN